MIALQAEYQALNIAPLLISCDSPEANQRFRKKLSIPFPLLTDRDHAVADRFGIPIARKHPKAWLFSDYPDGFIQPAVFAYLGEEEAFRFIQTPSTVNLWGAANRPDPAQVVAAVKAHAAAGAVKGS